MRPPRNAAAARTTQGSLLAEEVMSIINHNYVEEVDLRAKFDRAIKRQALGWLFDCSQGLPSMEECPESIEECLYEVADAISRRCGGSIDSIQTRLLRNMVRNLDPYCDLLSPQMLKELKVSTSGKFGGVGMVTAPRGGDYVVIAPFDGSPAQKAGVEPGDLVMAIDNDSIHGLPLVEVLRMVRGPVGSRIQLTLKKRSTGEIVQLTLRRKLIRVPPVRSVTLAGGVGYIRIVNFQRTTAREVKQALRKLFSSVPADRRRLILDLRDNPGGLFDQAIEAAGVLLESGVITIVKGRTEKYDRVFKVKRSGPYGGIPTVVLINRGTASASEILAGALHGKPKALVMGERSFGKASVQGVFLLRGGMALRITTAHYYTANSRNIDRVGIKPDITCEDHRQTIERDAMYVGKTDALAQDPCVIGARQRLEGAFPAGQTPFLTLY